MYNENDMFAYWLSGFIAGEGCFKASANKNGNYNVTFALRMRKDDSEIVFKIFEYFNKIGSINIFSKEYVSKFDNAKRNDVISYRISSIKDLYLVIVPFFTKYKLLAKKEKDFEIWKKIVTVLYESYRNRELLKQNKPLILDLIKQCHEIKKYNLT